MQQNSCFLVRYYYFSTDQNLLYHSTNTLPTHTQGSSLTTHCLLSDSKAVFSVGGWSLTILHCLWQNARWCWCLCCTAGHPSCSRPAFHLATRFARYSILVPLLLNQPWRVVSGVTVWEKGTHVWSEAHVSVGAHVVNTHLVTKEVLFTSLTENIAVNISDLALEISSVCVRMKS